MLENLKNGLPGTERFTFCLLAILCLFPLSAQAQNVNGPGRFFSPSVGQKFYEIAYELSQAQQLTDLDIRRAVTLLTATTNLDTRAKHTKPVILELASQYSDDRYLEMVFTMLPDYVNDDADLEIVNAAIRYILNQADSREQKERMLDALLQKLGERNSTLRSELFTSLAVLMIEKADNKTATALFSQAITYNQYNSFAFKKLAELQPEIIEPYIYFIYLRLRLIENPLDLESAMNLAQYAEETGLYQIAAPAYKYCAKLFEYLYPSQPMDTSIYLPWMISTYNVPREEHKCLKIIKSIRQSGIFDILAEAIAAKAAVKTGDTNLANRILRDAEEKALKLIAKNHQPSQPKPQAAIYKQLAWFYCFALPDPDSALDLANQIYSNEPNSSSAAAILAYAFVMNNQNDLAQQILDNYPPSQIADLALAKIQIASDRKDDAIETLKSAISRDPGNPEAEEAKNILAQLDAEYVGPIDTDVLLETIRKRFRLALIPRFQSPEKLISVDLIVRGNTFYYGSDFGGSLAIKNNSSQQLVISDNGMFKGNIRVDAEITGDINKKIPNLIVKRFLPANPIEPDQSKLVALQLFTGELRDILIRHPQASLNIEFTAYIDPVVLGQTVQNSIAVVEPAKITIKRPDIKLTTKYLQSQINSLPKTKQNLKIKSAQLFVGLLMEQYAMANRDPLYKFMYADWMPQMLKAALIHCLKDENWVTKVQTMIAMVSLPLDYKLTEAVAENLHDNDWPVRFTALYLLSKSQNKDFSRVLDWIAKNESERLVYEMAVALGGAEPEKKEQPRPTSEP